MKHPIHPILVHFPIAAWIISTLGDITSLFTNEQVSWVAGVLLVIGTITALFAMVTGLIELSKIDSQNPAMKIANQHMMYIMISWSCYAVSLFLRLDGTQLSQPGIFAIIMSVAGLKEKLLAAHRGGIKMVLIPEDNVKDLSEIPANIKAKLKIQPVKWIDQVLELALEHRPEALPSTVQNTLSTVGEDDVTNVIIKH